MRRPPAARAALLHGAFLLGAGLWPIVHLPSFAKVTGPRPEGWLAKAAGACMAEIGAALVAAGARGHVSRELRALGFATAAIFAGMDFWYAGVRRRIKPTYLINGGVQLAMATAWMAAQVRETLAARRAPEPAFA